MAGVYIVKDGQLITLFKEDENKVAYGLLILRKKGALPAIFERGNRTKIFSDPLDQIVLVDLIAGVYSTFYHHFGFPSQLLDAIMREPSQFMMEKTGEDSGIVVLACYHPYLIKAIKEDGEDLSNLLLKNDEIRQKVLDSSAVWQLSYDLFALMPCHCQLTLFGEEASLFRTGILLHEKDDWENDIYYCASNHPFYHDFIMLAKISPSIANRYLKTATERGIDATYPIIHSMLDKKIREKGIERLYDSGRWERI